METEIYDLIKSWASLPTWYTKHPSDQARFNQAISQVVDELGPNINIDSFENALRKHAEQTTPTLGAPQHWDEIINEFVLKAESIFEYEYDKTT